MLQQNVILKQENQSKRFKNLCVRGKNVGSIVKLELYFSWSKGEEGAVGIQVKAPLATGLLRASGRRALQWPYTSRGCGRKAHIGARCGRPPSGGGCDSPAAPQSPYSRPPTAQGSPSQPHCGTRHLCVKLTDD